MKYEILTCSCCPNCKIPAKTEGCESFFLHTGSCESRCCDRCGDLKIQEYSDDDYVYTILPENYWRESLNLHPEEPTTIRHLSHFIRTNNHIPITHLLNTYVFLYPNTQLEWNDVVSRDLVLDILGGLDERDGLKKNIKELRRRIAKSIYKGGDKLDKVREKQAVMELKEEFVMSFGYEPRLNELERFARSKLKYELSGHDLDHTHSGTNPNITTYNSLGTQDTDPHYTHGGADPIITTYNGLITPPILPQGAKRIVFEQVLRSLADVACRTFIGNLFGGASLLYTALHTIMGGSDLSLKSFYFMRPSREWLTNVQIDKVIKTFFKPKFPHIHYHTTSCSDYVHVLLKGIRDDKGKKRCMVVNTDLSTGRGEHWIFMGWEPSENTLYICDSGHGIVPKNAESEFVKYFDPSWNIKFPLMCYQQSSSECGLFSMIAMRLFSEGRLCESLVMPISDKTCVELRCELFEVSS